MMFFIFFKQSCRVVNASIFLGCEKNVIVFCRSRITSKLVLGRRNHVFKRWWPCCDFVRFKMPGECKEKYKKQQKFKEKHKKFYLLKTDFLFQFLIKKMLTFSWFLYYFRRNSIPNKLFHKKLYPPQLFFL